MNWRQRSVLGIFYFVTNPMIIKKKFKKKITMIENIQNVEVRTIKKKAASID